MILDFRNDRTAAVHEADIAIVGAGPVGITLARELSSVASVLVIDAAGLEINAEQMALLEGECAGLHYPLTETRARAFGGSSTLWAGYCAAFDAHDFEVRPGVKGSGWPIARAEVERWYAPVAALLGLGEPDFEAERIVAELGLDVPLPRDTFTVTTWRFATPTPRFGERFRSEFAESRSVTTLLNASVVDIRLDAAHARVSELILRTLGGREGRVRAATVVLACGGIDTPRLLLNSRGQVRAGVGNESDQVGRYFMEHPHRSLPVRAADAPWLRRSIERGTYGDRREFMFAFGLSREAQRDATILNARMHAYRTPTMTDTEPAKLGLFMEQAPRSDSRVMLSTQVDALGMHRVRLDWRLGAVDHRSYLRTAAVFVDAFERLGLCSRVANDGEPDAVLPSNHQLGTTRMSCRQEDGVVDADCRIHTLENAYIMGGSVLPTVSWANPTFTVLALTLRLADTLRRRHLDQGEP